LRVATCHGILRRERSTMDYSAATARQQAAWSAGDFNVLGMQTMTASDALCAAVDPRPDQRILDVACGSGNAALVMARRYCDATGVDFVPSLVERAKQRAAADGTKAEFLVGDAQALPFGDSSFDMVVSVFGVMFAPDQEKAASELLRVCRPGGVVGLACWTPEGFGGEFFRAVSTFIPPPEGLKPPVRWGTEQGVRELLGGGTSAIRTEKRSIFQYFRSIDHAIDVFKSFFGPVHRAFEIVDPAQRPVLRDSLGAVFSRYNRATDGSVVLECAYCQTIAKKR
jgi:SAM-dependent methyltransferase